MRRKTSIEGGAKGRRAVAGKLIALVAAALVCVTAANGALARAGASSSSGSRGSQTYSAPPSTATAPRPAAPMERSMTPAPTPGMGQPGMARPGAAMPVPGQRPGFFSGGGFMAGLAGGLIGAGIGGMLFGGGFGAGLGGFASFLGLLLQILLIVVVVRLAIGFFRNRARGAAYAGPGADIFARRADGPAAGEYPGGRSGGGGSGAATGAPVDAVGIAPSDFAEFERLLIGVQDAYAREDLNALTNLATPEMVSYFARDLARNASRGVINRVSDVGLRQGDLAEAWPEGEIEYATVAMRFALIDVTVERAGGRVVAGDPARPVEATEVWTFMRQRGGRWLVSAIQQA